MSPPRMVNPSSVVLMSQNDTPEEKKLSVPPPASSITSSIAPSQPSRPTSGSDPTPTHPTSKNHAVPSNQSGDENDEDDLPYWLGVCLDEDLKKKSRSSLPLPTCHKTNEDEDMNANWPPYPPPNMRFNEEVTRTIPDKALNQEKGGIGKTPYRTLNQEEGGKSSVVDRRPSDRESGRSDFTRLIIFDFDLTISTIHVFKFLAGWMSPPGCPTAATSELGQLTRVVELDNEYPEGFALYAMGGPERVAKLDRFFTELHEHRAELIVCSKGLIGPIRKILHDTKLLRHFTSVYAHSGEIYGASTEYDTKVKQTPTLSKEQIGEFMVEGAYAHLGGKEYLMNHLLRERKLPKEAGILVEDDRLEIDKCMKYSRTFLIDPPRGMNSTHMADLLAMATV